MFHFTEGQKLQLLSIIEKYIKSSKQGDCFVKFLEKGMSYYCSQIRRNSLHNSLPETYKNNDLKKLKSSLKKLSNNLGSLEYVAPRVINQAYYMREKKMIPKDDNLATWELSLQILLDDLAIACDDLINDEKKYNMKRGYKLELLLVDAIDRAIDESGIDLNIAVGGNRTPSMILLEYLILELKVKGINNFLASPYVIIDRWVKKQADPSSKKKTSSKKALNPKNKLIQESLANWKPVIKK